MKRILALLFILPQLSFASALVIRDNEKLELRVVAKMHYYGDAATEAIASASKEEINRMWNEPNIKVLLYDKNPGPSILGRSSTQSSFKYYSLKFEVEYEVHKEKPQMNASCASNYIEVRNASGPNEFSYYESVRSREGVFITDDDLGNSTTAAHEFGHGLGLDHPYEDQRSAKVPGIMFARGTKVRAEFQLDPKASSQSKMGRINPYTRKVRAEDIKAIKWAGIWYDTNEACLGMGTRDLKF